MLRYTYLADSLEQCRVPAGIRKNCLDEETQLETARVFLGKKMEYPMRLRTGDGGSGQ